jgi:hypothetical protein
VNCACHDEPAYWNPDRRGVNGGYWRCRVKVRERQRAADLAYWHRADGGYIRRRKRHLAGQRTEIEGRLRHLQEEAGSC